MAESVTKQFEAVGEIFAEIQRSNLFNKQEINTLKKRIKDFLQKTNGVTKYLEDFKAYLSYLRFLLKQIKVRRDKHLIFDRRQSIEYKIIRHIKHQYELALMRFSDDYSFHMKFIEFAKKYNFYQVVAHHLKQMVMLFSNKIEIYQIAAEWFAKHNKPQALNILHRGLLLHPKCTTLYLDVIDLELNECNKDPKFDTKQCYDRLKTYVDSIFKDIKDIKFVIDVMHMFEKHQFTDELQNSIIKILLEQYPTDDSVWNMLGQRELRGKHYGLLENEVPLKSAKYLFNRCRKKYEQGLTMVEESRKSALWCQYLDTIIEFQRKTVGFENFTKTAALRDILERACVENVKLEERHFAAWMEVHMDNEEKILQIFDKAITDLPNSMLLWELYLKFYILKDNCVEVNKVFKRAVETLKENSETIWFIVIQYHLLRSHTETVNSIYVDAINAPQPVSNTFKPDYISWLVVTKGIEDARKVYKTLATKQPYCKQLHIAMAKAESIEATDENASEWENCLKLATEQFGKDDIDVWLQYIQFFLIHHKVLDANDKIQQICRDAENTLLPLLVYGFKEEYAKMVSEISMT